MSHELERRIAELARSQHGVVTRSQLLGMGLSACAVHRRERAGRLDRLHRGIYAVGPIRGRRAREMAAVSACGPDAVVSHRSAAALWGLIPDEDGAAPVHVTVADRYNRSRTGIVVHRVRSLADDARAAVEGIPVTAPGPTLIALATRCGRAELERAVARADREGLVSEDLLRTLVERCRGRRGILRLRSILDAEGGPALTRSAAEARFLHVIRRAGLPVPEVNARVAEYEVDFLWPAERIAVEVDGYRWHRSRTRFERDRRRATALAARGIQVIPLTWRQIVDEELATAVQLGRALDRAAAHHRSDRRSRSVPSVR